MLNLSAHRIYSFHTFAAAFESRFDHGLTSLADGLPKSGLIGSEDFDRGSARTVPAWVPERLRPAVTSRYGLDPVFTGEMRPYGASLLLPLHRLVSGQLNHRCKTFALGPRARSLLNEGNQYLKETPPEQRYGHRLAMIMSSAAERRVSSRLPGGSHLPSGFFAVRIDGRGKEKNQFVVPITVVDAFIYLFSTGRLVCQLALEAHLPKSFPMSSTLLAEMTDHAGRFARIGWLEGPPAKPSEEGSGGSRLIEVPGFTLGSLAARLLFGADARIQTSQRTFTYAYALVDPDGPTTERDDLERLGSQLARQYTDDYALNDDAPSIKRVSDFANVTHALACEGGATIVDPRTDGRRIDFLEHYLEETLEPNYLPIAVMNLHQLTRSLELAARAVLRTSDPPAVGDDRRGPIDEAAELTSMIHDWHRLQEGLATLKSRFRHRHVSQISMHNAFNRAMRDCFGLDGLEDQLSSDLAEMSETVRTAILLRSQERRRRFDLRYDMVLKAVAGLGAGLVAAELVSAVSTLSQDGLASWDYVGLAAVFAAAVSGFAWASVVKKQAPKEPD